MNIAINIGIIIGIIVAGAIGKGKMLFNDFLLVFQFITRLPVNISLKCEQENFKKGTLYFSVVGAIIGALEYLVFMGSYQILPLPIASVLTVLSGIFITGGLHMDGLGDTCDGFFAFKGKDRIIEIMKDSRVGTFGVIALIMEIIFKIVGIYYLGTKDLAYMIIVVPCISRLSLVYLSLIGKTAKKNGTGNLYIGNTNIIYFMGGIILTLAIGNLFFSIETILFLIVAAIVISSIFNIYCVRRIGGLSGDTLGANNEIIEIALFLILCSTMF